MADISKITTPNGTTYNLKDQQARDDISAIQSAIAGGVTFMGETSTALTDGSTVTSIVINSATVTAVKGYLVVYNSKEFVFDGTKWIELGDLSLIGDLGWKDSASATYTPTGFVSQPTFSGDNNTVNINIQPISQNNLLENVVWTNGSFYDNNGNIVTSSNSKRVDEYIPVNSSSLYTISLVDSSSNKIRIHEYDSSQTWHKQAINTYDKDAVWTTRDDTAYIRLSVPIDATDIVLTKNEGAIAGYINEVAQSYASIPQSTLSLSGNFVPEGSVNLTKSNKTTTVSSTSGTATYTPAGTISQPTFSGNSTTSTGTFTPKGSVNLTNSNKTTTVSSTTGAATYTPAGSVTAPTISVKTAGATTSITPITSLGQRPDLSTSVSNETLIISFDRGTLPTQGTPITVKTGDAVYQSTAPSFSGTGVRLVTGNIEVPTSASFTGTEEDISVSGTPSGTVSQPSFSGTGVRLVTGNIEVPTSASFTGTEGNVSVSGQSEPIDVEVTNAFIAKQITATVTPTGTVSRPTFSGTEATITVT